MTIAEKIYHNKKSIFVFALIMTLIGTSISYVAYGIEPWETFGGFICGLGLGISIFSLAVKKPNLEK